jgi:hypothetical protein
LGERGALLKFAEEIAGIRRSVPATAFAAAAILLDQLRAGEIHSSVLQHVVAIVEELVGLGWTEPRQPTTTDRDRR